MRRGWLVLGVVVLAALPARAVDKEAIQDAVDKGVQVLRAMQRPDGSWAHAKIGATALAGLTLLECGIDKDDRAVKAAAQRVRGASYTLTDTYSLALAVLFLDRLDVRQDTPLIESMLVRLLAGQTSRGAFGYECPPIVPGEQLRLKAECDGSRVLRGGRDLDKLPAKGKRKPSDLSREILAQLEAVSRGGAPGGLTLLGAIDHGMGGDNSNTQFATMALWVGRRYGVPTQKALLRVNDHFRLEQCSNGGWAYSPNFTGIPPGPGGWPAGNATATMTCAGLLGLAAGHGANLDIRKAKDPDLESADVSKDRQLKAGMVALAATVGKPTGWRGTGRPSIALPRLQDRDYYFLWSLERVAVTYDLQTIGKNDWYQWGAELLLANQAAGWHAAYSAGGADTCFALLFLKRTNLLRDLTAGLTGSKGLGERALISGGVGGAALLGKGGAALAGIGAKADTSADGEKGKGAAGKVKPEERAKPGKTEQTAAARMTDELVKARGERRAELLEKLRDGKGADHTEALASAIGKLDGDDRRLAREALADRLTRMKPATLREYLKDEEAEVRRAAALAVAQQDSKLLVPDVIGLLKDPSPLVRRAAHAALKALSGKDFGPAADADAAERLRAIAAWRSWWKKQARE
jgi:hypothetical protein